MAAKDPFQLISQSENAFHTTAQQASPPLTASTPKKESNKAKEH
jgi:hypothetical protein